MIPLGDDRRAGHRTPYVVIALILLNALVFIYELNLSTEALQRVIFAWGLTPYEIVNRVDLSPEINAPVWVTVFSAMFLHSGWLHLAGNMLYLWIFGDNVEDAMGHLPFLLFYLLCGIGAALLHIAFNRDATVPMIGASGALSGVLGAYLLMFPRKRVRVLIFLGIFVTVISLPSLLVIGFWVVLQLLSSIATVTPDAAQSDGVAYLAHVGGFLAGVLLLLCWRRPVRTARRFAGRG